MNPLKSSLSRALRSASVAHPQAFKAATRAIAGTTRNGSHLNSTPQPQSHSFIPPSILSTTTTTTTTPPQQTSTATPFTHLLTSITHHLATYPTPHLPTLTALLRAYTSNPTHWSPYAHADAGKQYTRNLVTGVPDLFNLLLLVWTPGKMSPVHDHAGAHCLMKVLKGDLVERRFEIPPAGREGVMETGMREIARRVFAEEKVGYMSDELGVHEISNPSPTEYAVSLHLYTPPHAATRGCHVYDIENGAARHVTQCSYDSIDGVPTAAPQ